MSIKNEGGVTKVTIDVDDAKKILDKLDKVEKSKEVAEDKYWDAIDVKEIANKFIQAGSFQFPTNTPICYVFVNKSKAYWGKCQHASALTKFSTGYEYYLIINHEIWQTLNELQREALIFHELLHIAYNIEKDKYSIADHDLEEFSRVVKKFGMWRESVTAFTNVAMEKIHDDGE